MGVVQRDLIDKVNGSNVSEVIDEYNRRLLDEYCRARARTPVIDEYNRRLLDEYCRARARTPARARTGMHDAHMRDPATSPSPRDRRSGPTQYNSP